MTEKHALFSEDGFLYINKNSEGDASGKLGSGNAISFSHLNRFKDQEKADEQYTIVLFSAFSRHFGHWNEKVIARNYNIDLVQLDLPGIGHSSSKYTEEDVIALLKTRNIGRFSVFAQGLASNFKGLAFSWPCLQTNPKIASICIDPVHERQSKIQ